MSRKKPDSNTSTAPDHITQQDKDDFAAEQSAQIQNTGAAIISIAQSDHEIASAMINQRIGRRSAYSMVSKLLTVADLVDLQNIKDSKGYKGFNTLIEGKLLTVSTWDEYCEHVEKRSRQTIDNDLLNLSALGPELFESMRTVGIGPGTMRAIRQLPTDDQELIQQAVSTNNKDELAEFVEQLIAKNVKEKSDLTKKVEDLKQDIAAKDAVATSNAQRINVLQEKVARIKKESPDETIEELRKEAAQLAIAVELSIRGSLRSAIQALRQYEHDTGVEQGPFIAGLFGMSKRALAEVQAEYDVSETTSADDLPAWLREDADAALDAALNESQQ